MRKTNLVTISLPPSMALEARKVARKQGMTRSELLRSALRRYIEEMRLDEAVRIADEELASGKAKILPKGGLAALLKK
mgnify:CR=1 FL=1